MPNKQITDGNYRYAYQGQELDGETGMEAFQLRLWDGRIGRWLNPDPYGQYFSPYLGMGNNPANRIDPDGGTDGGPDDPPCGNGGCMFFPMDDEYGNYGGSSGGGGGHNINPAISVISNHLNTGKYSFTYSNTSGPHGGTGGSTSIFQLYGGNGYTNSTPNGDPGGILGFLSNMSEPNNGGHFQIRYKSTNYQYGLIYFKNKLKDKNGIGFQHPSSFYLTLSKNNLNSFNLNSIKFSTNLSLGLGYDVGIPRSISSPANGKNNKIIGYGGALIYRLDARIIGGFYLHTTLTYHHLQTFDQKETEYSGEGIGSLGVSFGGGITFGN